MKIFIVRHKIALVFPGPGRWAAVFGWEEEYCIPGCQMTYFTGNMDFISIPCTKKWYSKILVFNSIKLRVMI